MNSHSSSPPQVCPLPDPLAVEIFNSVSDLFLSPPTRYGPCQTPTLGFCVERHQRIATFTPENFWSVRPTLQKGGRRIPLEWERGRVFDKEIAQVFQRIVVEGGAAQVLEYGAKEERKGRPAGLNTVEMLKVASSGLNLGPHHAMQVGEFTLLCCSQNEGTVG